METDRDIVAIDGHRAWIEQPDALLVQLSGDMTGENMGKLHEMMDRMGDGQGPVIIMQDLSKAGAFTAAARKGIMANKRTHRITSVICIGASFQMRVFMTMISKALKFLNPMVSRTLFAKDEAEGRELLAAERERLKQNN
jgi:hypothetical protein